MEDRLSNLALDDTNEGFEFSELGEDQSTISYDLCLVGTFVIDHPTILWL